MPLPHAFTTWFYLVYHSKTTRSDSINTKSSLYIPYAFRAFQDSRASNIKEFQETRPLEIVLARDAEKTLSDSRCGNELGAQEGRI